MNAQTRITTSRVRPIVLCLLAGLVAMWLSVASSAATKPVLDLTGTWTGTFVDDDGETGTLELTLRRKGSIRNYAGTLIVRGDDTLTYRGRVTYTRSDRIKGEFHFGRGKLKQTVKARGAVDGANRSIDGSYSGKAGRERFSGRFELSLP